EYVLTSDGGYVIVAPGDGRKSRIEKLAISKENAQALGAKPGPLTRDQATEELAALLDLLSRPGQTAQSAPRLAALWQVLIPTAERELLRAGKIKHLYVVPDGPLSRLPFEALIVESEPRRYLVDTRTPISYGPSATILHRLATRPAQAG